MFIRFVKTKPKNPHTRETISRILKNEEGYRVYTRTGANSKKMDHQRTQQEKNVNKVCETKPKKPVYTRDNIKGIGRKGIGYRTRPDVNNEMRVDVREGARKQEKQIEVLSTMTKQRYNRGK